MYIQHESELTKSTGEEISLKNNVEQDEAADEDTDPPLDEEDLEENNLTVEEADQIVWEQPDKSSSGKEEKDIID